MFTLDILCGWLKFKLDWSPGKAYVSHKRRLTTFASIFSWVYLHKILLLSAIHHEKFIPIEPRIGKFSSKICMISCRISNWSCSGREKKMVCIRLAFAIDGTVIMLWSWHLSYVDKLITCKICIISRLGHKARQDHSWPVALVIN